MVDGDLTAANGASPILLEHTEEFISKITLNRPAQRNAMNAAARQALREALEECRAAGAKVVIITGAGPAFCAGMDLKEGAAERASIAEGDAGGRRTASTEWISLQNVIRHHPAVVIASVNGVALGGGLTLINSADLAVAAEDAGLGMPEVSFGVYPGMAGPTTQVRLSSKRAAFMVLTAARIDGRKAEEWGLVNAAVPADRLAEETLALARRIAAYDAVTLEFSKRALWEIPMRRPDWDDALEFAQEIGAQIRERSDAGLRGVQAFAEGRRSAGQGG
jgi:enoyl-CoA hydratase/carnithine racemase